MSDEHLELSGNRVQKNDWIFESKSGINFLCAGTIALIFINYNVQLGLSQVPLGSLINRTEICTVSISIVLLQFLLRCVCDVLNSVLCNFSSVFLNSIPFVQFLFKSFPPRIYKLHRFCITLFKTGFWRR